jgi:hypothetical protein
MDLRLPELVKELGALPESRFRSVMTLLFLLSCIAAIGLCFFALLKTGVI